MKSTLSGTFESFAIASNLIINIINIRTNNASTSNAIISSSSTMKLSWRATIDLPPSSSF